MLYLVHMVVNPPVEPSETFEHCKREEKQMARELQRDGIWLHLWRVVGEYANYSIFDVSDHDALHRILTSLPLYPYLEIKVTPLATHPSALPSPRA